MIERPLLMSAAMVRAILREIREPGTGKVKTRRLAHAWLQWLSSEQTGAARRRLHSFTPELFEQAVSGRDEIRKIWPDGQPARRVGFRWTSESKA